MVLQRPIDAGSEHFAFTHHDGSERTPALGHVIQGDLDRLGHPLVLVHYSLLGIVPNHPRPRTPAAGMVKGGATARRGRQLQCSNDARTSRLSTSCDDGARCVRGKEKAPGAHVRAGGAVSDAPDPPPDWGHQPPTWPSWRRSEPAR